MCTIGILHRVHRDVPLAIVANRDEFYARPARPPEILDAAIGAAGGVDAQSGGTWLAVSRRGRIVAVTNQRVATPALPNVRSRGHAVRGALAADDLDAYVRALDPREFSSMNLLYGDARELRVAYFRHDAGTLDIDTLAPGVHVLCNDRLGAPGFPRGERLAAILRSAVDLPWPVARARLAAIVGDHTLTADPPVQAGLAPDVARALTAICIHSPHYGTRSSALVALADTAVREYLHAEGPPCQAPFVDYTRLVA